MDAPQKRFADRTAQPHAACSSCAFWVLWERQLTPKYTIGDCRKHAPVVFMQPDGNFASKWPSTKSRDFCGAFHPHKQASPL